MTKIDIVSGFLGAGKTTLIKKMVKEAYQGEKLVLIENEFGEISIDGGFLKDAGIQISEMSSGCICCSLVGDFGKALREVKEQFQPDRILIEPSGVGKLSDVIVAVENTVADIPDMKLNSFVTVADAGKVKVYMKNFGEFYNNQIEAAGTIILSRTQKLTQEKLEAAVALLREKNPTAAILTTPWDQLDGQAILAAVEKVSLADELLEKMRAEHEAEEAEHHHHHHEHDDDDGHDEHEHHHHHDDEDHSHCDHEHGHCCHHHHHGDDDEEYGIGTFVYHSRRPFNQEKLQEFVNNWPKGVVRAKGILWFSDKDKRDYLYVFEQAGVQITATENGKWLAAFPKNEQKKYFKEYPDIEEHWDEKYGDREIKLVFIGQHMDKSNIIERLDNCLDD